MADDFTVSGGGVVRVSTEEMATHVARLHAFAETTSASRARLAVIDELLSREQLAAFDAPWSVVRAEPLFTDAMWVLWSVRAQTDVLITALDLAADAYGTAEHLAAGLTRQFAAHIAYGLGAAYPFVLTWLTPRVGGALGGWALTPEERRCRTLEWLERHGPAALSDPRLVALVRLSVMSVDEFGAGVMRIPGGVLGVLGDEALGVLGLSASAAVLSAALRRFGLATETPVSVRRTETVYDVGPPQGFEDQVARIPGHDPQIRIERYEIPGQPDRFHVYISGTRDGSPFATSEPFDMSSNLTAMSMGDAGSVRAVQMAMREAGITAETPVQFTGYSQGAIVAVVLANSGEYDARGIFTVGGPTGQLDVPKGVPYLALEHHEDIVPALGGSHTDLDTVLVQRSLFDGGVVPDTSLLPAHELTRYQESAALLDKANEQRVVGVADAMNDFASGATSVETTSWQATRTPGETAADSGSPGRRQSKG